MCANEVARTVAFIRGVHDAIQAVGNSSQGRRTRVLYAGCGPYALLAIPQMAVFTPQQVSFTLLDCHDRSLGSARTIVDRLGLAAYVIRYHAGDATQYDIPADETPDVIVSETMNRCLDDEPQVAIARHLMRQAPAAFLVPQSVSVEARLVDMSREFAFQAVDHDGDPPVPDRDRVPLGQVFELSAATIAQWAAHTGDCLPAARIAIPNPLAARYEACLFTEIHVFGETHLADYDCSLTYPKTIPVTGAVRGGDSFQFHYRLGRHPQLDCERVPVPSCDGAT